MTCSCITSKRTLGNIIYLSLLALFTKLKDRSRVRRGHPYTKVWVLAYHVLGEAFLHWWQEEVKI